MQKVVTRFNTITGMTYKDDSTIMAWELMNEPRNQADYSGNTLNVRTSELNHELISQMLTRSTD